VLAVLGCFPAFAMMAFLAGLGWSLLVAAIQFIRRIVPRPVAA
jgi:hypothetical protein